MDKGPLPVPLVTTEWLHSHLDEPDLVVVDASVQMIAAPPHRAHMREAYAEAHIPGAVYANIVDDFSEPDSLLPITRPSADRLATAIGRLGIGPDTDVAVYDRSGGQSAARFWWLLQSAGHDRIAVLNGGLPRWIADGHFTESGAVDPLPVRFPVRLRPEMWADKKQVMDVVHGAASATLVNALPELPQEPSALPPEVLHILSASIPGSVAMPFPSLAEPGSSTLRPAAELTSHLAPVTAGKRAIVYCASGLSAPLVGLGLIASGHTDVAVYDGSIEEWLSDPDAPVVHQPIR
jgi:thiosulfate/3-mercaptopyruvate sulfurtransferase